MRIYGDHPKTTTVEIANPSFVVVVKPNLYRRLARFACEPFLEKTERVSQLFWLLKTQLYYRLFFRHIGHRSRIIHPLRIKHVEFISLGDEVTVHKHCWLQTFPDLKTSPELIIGSGSVIGNFSHITCTNRISIGEKVLIADRVFITDHGHEYDNPLVPIIDQPVVARGPVEIGNGSWIGENAVIMSCRIGANCVIGANAVVVSDIPDYSVAAGIPAKVIKKFCLETKLWRKV